jgi:O-antigen ligase
MKARAGIELRNQSNSVYPLMLIVGLGTLTISTSFFDPINIPKLIAITLPLPWLVLNLLRMNQNIDVHLILKNRIYLLFSVSLLSLVILLLFSPTTFERRLFGIWGRNNGIITSFVSLAVAWAAYELVSRGYSILKLAKISLAILATTGVYGLIQVADLDPINWSSGSMRIFGTFGNTNFASAAWALGAMLSLFIFFFGVDQENTLRNRAILYLPIFSVFSFLSVKTMSIQGPLAIIVFVVLLTVLKLWSSQKKFYQVSSLLIIALGSIFAHSLYFNGPFTRIISEAGSLGFRKIYWNLGWKMFLENPLLGVGVDSYGDFFRISRTSEMATRTSIDLVVNNAHNTFLQTLGTMGFVGALGLIFPVVVALYLGLRHVLKETFGIKSGIFAIFVSLWLMASFSIDNISITLWNWLFLGIVFGIFAERKETSPSIGNVSTSSKLNNKKGKSQEALYDLGKVATGFSTFLLFLFLWSASAPDRVLMATLSKPVSFSQPETVNERLLVLGDLSFSRNLDPQHYLTIGRSLVELQQVPQASEVLSRGTIRYAQDFALWDYLAFTLEKQGKIQEAIPAREKQVLLDPRHARVWSYLAQDYAASGDLQKAKAAATKSLEEISVFAPSDQQSIRDFLNQLKLG